MRALASNDLLTSPAEEPSQTGLQPPRRNSPRAGGDGLPSEKSPPSSARNGKNEELRSLSSQNTDFDSCGRHFLFDSRWRNGIFNSSPFRDDTILLPPVSRDYHIHRSHNTQRLSHQKPPSCRISKPCVLRSCEEYELTSVPSVLSTHTTPPIRVKSHFPDRFNKRSKMNKRVRKLFGVGSNNSIQTYSDPVLGAPASFIHRMSEISSLQEETVRQERMKNLKKIKRQEA